MKPLRYLMFAMCDDEKAVELALCRCAPAGVGFDRRLCERGASPADGFAGGPVTAVMSNPRDGGPNRPQVARLRLASTPDSRGGHTEKPADRIHGEPVPEPSETADHPVGRRTRAPTCDGTAREPPGCSGGAPPRRPRTPRARRAGPTTCERGRRRSRSDRSRPLAGPVYLLYERTLVVRLVVLDGEPQSSAFVDRFGNMVGEMLVPVDLRLAVAEQVQVRTRQEDDQGSRRL